MCVFVRVCRLSYAEAMAAIAAKQHAMTSSLRYVTWLLSNPTYLNLNQQGGGGGGGEHILWAGGRNETHTVRTYWT